MYAQSRSLNRDAPRLRVLLQRGDDGIADEARSRSAVADDLNRMPLPCSDLNETPCTDPMYYTEHPETPKSASERSAVIEKMLVFVGLLALSNWRSRHDSNMRPTV
jgi:hypothetical protein